MPVANVAIPAALEEIADRLELQDANPFHVRAYRNAARTVQSLGRDVQAMAARGETLEGTPGIGADFAQKIAEIATRGSCPMLDRLRGEMPAAITELLQVPGLGPKRVRALWHELDVMGVLPLQFMGSDSVQTLAKGGRGVRYLCAG